MFFCEDQLASLDDEEEREMYMYGSERINTIRRSNIVTVLDPRLSEEQQEERNREAYMA
ncbi:predicted protein [Pyrenophora tritici-repentis Pt-1C-BFP]|uniref:Uncharacterized protein n=1 Tax=Pyrenophora tritici-repentis (strain Pt-1C-BFP) TaxID=426418 RepID=B2WFY5_PYRTR|nr:uncharacterized protein PTRG_08841 [Pyrenophora tritici-repentis Pt-1C-BFP]EDU41892.1 predicted protein [Pyrenophora tritici-repentis Pt-1C-BFP]